MNNYIILPWVPRKKIFRGMDLFLRDKILEMYYILTDMTHEVIVSKHVYNNGKYNMASIFNNFLHKNISL